jgi:hypothetical protein
MDAGIALNAAKCRNAGSTRRKSASSESGGGAASTGAEYSISETSSDPYKSDDPPYFNNDGTKKKKKRKHPKGSAKKRSKTAKDPLDNDILEGFGGGIGQNSIITDHLKAQALHAQEMSRSLQASATYYKMRMENEVRAAAEPTVVVADRAILDMTAEQTAIWAAAHLSSLPGAVDAIRTLGVEGQDLQHLNDENFVSEGMTRFHAAKAVRTIKALMVSR